MPSTHLPFQKLSVRKCLNFAWIALALFYLLFTAGSVWTRGMFGFIGSDYLSFRCSAEIAWSAGFDKLYDLDRQRQCQGTLVEAYAPEPPAAAYAPAPLFYLPAFIPLFMVLLPFGPLPGFIVWTILNAALLLFYLWRFLRALGEGYDRRILFTVLLSAPVFGILFFGQISIWLLVFMGEFLLAAMRGEDVFAGLWLGGLLLKPQTLILLLPGLLIGRRFKMLAGFAVTGLILLVLSVSLTGVQGMIDLGQLLLRASGELATTHPEVMMNWRSLAVNLGALMPLERLAWGLSIAGMVLTAVVALWLWFRPAASPSPRFVLVLLGTYAATGAVTWHSHTNLAVALVPLLLFLEVKRCLPRAALEVWLLVPAAIFPLAFLTVPGVAYNLVGLSLFILNLYFLAWVARSLWRQRTLGRASGPAHRRVEGG